MIPIDTNNESIELTAITKLRHAALWELSKRLNGQKQAAEQCFITTPIFNRWVTLKAAFPSSGEINFTLDDPKAAIARVRAAYEADATAIDEMDGLGIDLGDWRFNLRSSNTEPVVRLNVEARGDAALVAEGVTRVKSLLS